MSTVRYTVYAYSPTQNQEIRRIDLADPLEDLTLEQAQQHADWFARIQNRDMTMRTNDWQGRVKQENLGISTLDGYQG
jgi:hypothetical protein